MKVERTWHLQPDLTRTYTEIRRGEWLTPTRRVRRQEEANLVASLLTNGRHAPALDLDGVGARLVPSSTEGNFHLYLDDLQMSWPIYRFLLWALMVSGVIQRGFYKASVARRMSTLRPPWVKKPTLPNGEPAF